MSLLTVVCGMFDLLIGRNIELLIETDNDICRKSDQRIARCTLHASTIYPFLCDDSY